MERMSILDTYYGEGKSIREKITELEEENRSLKNELMEDMKTESKLNEEIRNLKSELEFYKKQYKHTMGEDYIDEDLYDLDC